MSGMAPRKPHGVAGPTKASIIRPIPTTTRMTRSAVPSLHEKNVAALIYHPGSGDGFSAVFHIRAA
jgi:hypothetical protein